MGVFHVFALVRIILDPVHGAVPLWIFFFLSFGPLVRGILHADIFDSFRVSEVK